MPGCADPPASRIICPCFHETLGAAHLHAIPRFHGPALFSQPDLPAVDANCGAGEETTRLGTGDAECRHQESVETLEIDPPRGDRDLIGHVEVAKLTVHRTKLAPEEAASERFVEIGRPHGVVWRDGRRVERIPHD